MIVRTATHDDIPAIAKLGAAFHAQAQWSDVFDYNEGDCAASLSALMASDAFICIVADGGEIEGMAAGVVSPVYFNHGHVSGEELFWWVSDKAAPMTGMRMLTALEGEAKAKGCQSWQMKSIARLNGDRMGRVYARRGYRPSEHTFIKRFG